VGGRNARSPPWWESGSGRFEPGNGKREARLWVRLQPDTGVRLKSNPHKTAGANARSPSWKAIRISHRDHRAHRAGDRRVSTGITGARGLRADQPKEVMHLCVRLRPDRSRSTGVEPEKIRLVIPYSLFPINFPVPYFANCTSISTNMPGPASPATCTVERAGRFGCSLVPKNCE
jgi:hypothetical protein